MSVVALRQSVRATIRPAEGDDLPRLLEMGRMFNEEAGYAETIPFDEESFGRTLVALAKAGLLTVAADPSGRPIGMAACDVAPSICNYGVRLAREAFWFLDPEARGGNAIGREMLFDVECAARDHGASFFDVVAEQGERSEALGRLYRRAGFNPAEKTFRKRL